MSRLILLATIAGTTTRYLATEQYCTRNADTPANTLFDGRLIDAVYERAVSYQHWDRAGGGQAVSYLEFINTDGDLDSWLTESWRDVRITLRVVAAGSSYASSTQVGVAVCDRIEAPSNNRIRLVCRSVFERLEKVITTNYPDSITNETLRARPKPITLGHVRWLDPLNPRLNVPAGATRGVHDVADGPFLAVSEVRSRGALATEIQDTLPTGTEYFQIQDSDGYGYLFRSQDYRHAVDVLGQVRLDTQALTHYDFPSDSGGDPTGWTVSESGGSTVAWNSAGSVTIDGAASAVSLLQAMSTTAGYYRIEVDVTSGTGVLQIMAGGSVIRSVEVPGPNTVSFWFSSAGGSVSVGVSIDAGATANYTLSAIRAYRVYRINALTEIVRFAGVTRGSLSTGDLDLTALAAVDSGTGYLVGWTSLGGEVRGIDLVNLAARSYGASIFQNASGQLVPVQLAAPGSPSFTLDEFQIKEISYEVDLAPGLSTRINYGRNYAPHTSDDMTLATDPAIRAELASEVKTVATTATLHAMYATAAERDALESILSELTDAQSEIDRLCGLYTQVRAFYTVKAFVEDVTPHTIEPGDVVTVTHSRYGLSGGVDLLVVAARSDFTGQSVDLVLWG